MKLIKAIRCILIGYVAAIAYFTLLLLVHGESLKQDDYDDYLVVIIMVAIYGFGTMMTIFLIPFLFSRGASRFWDPSICGPIGGLLGFIALVILVRPLAFHYMYGGQAAIMSGVTFLMGSRTLRSSNKGLLRTGAPQTVRQSAEP